MIEYIGQRIDNSVSKIKYREHNNFHKYIEAEDLGCQIKDRR